MVKFHQNLLFLTLHTAVTRTFSGNSFHAISPGQGQVEQSLCYSSFIWRMNGCHTTHIHAYCHARQRNNIDGLLLSFPQVWNHSRMAWISIRSNLSEIKRQLIIAPFLPPSRSEERRVGKEFVSRCTSRWSPYH